MSVASHAPDLDRPGLEWFNVDRPLNLKDLQGRVVILDFWTFCCINCMHAFPVLQRIEEQFPNDVVVIDVHSPKFEAERDSSKLKDAIRRHDIRHPVIHDPRSLLWDEYLIRAWPTLVVIAPDGKIAQYLPGEPDIEELLAVIEKLVESGGPKPTRSLSSLSIHPVDTHQGNLLFPGKIKPAIDRNGVKQWALVDSGHHRVLVLNDKGNPVASYGKGTPGLTDGPGSEAEFSTPQGLVATPESIFVADTGNHAIRRIDRTTGVVSTLAGNGARGPTLQKAQAASAAVLASPWDLEYTDHVIYFANAGTHQIGLLEIRSNRLSPLAGTGREALSDGPAPYAALAQPSGLALSIDRKTLFLADSETSSIRQLVLQTAALDTVVGKGLFTFGHQDGPVERALLQHPLGVAVCDARTLYVADSYNDCIRRIDLEQKFIETCDLPELREPAGIVCDGPGRLFISDTGAHRILEWKPEDNTCKTWFE